MSLQFKSQWKLKMAISEEILNETNCYFFNDGHIVIENNSSEF
jgi:hypothetical protein